MTARPIFAWYDLWIGAYWDRKARKLYVLPLPCVGIVIGAKAMTTRDRADIEREGALSDMETLRAEKRELQADNERLRAALQAMTDLCKTSPADPFLADNMDRIARRAQEPKP